MYVWPEVTNHRVDLNQEELQQAAVDYVRKIQGIPSGSDISVQLTNGTKVVHNIQAEISFVTKEEH
jgi:hypothetical protein